MINNINVGSTPNDGTGDVLREGFLKVNENFDTVQVELSGKAATIHTHTIAQVDGLQTSLNTLQQNINNVNASLSGYAETDVYDLINQLQDMITDQNNVILQQNQTINAQQDTINYILSIIT